MPSGRAEKEDKAKLDAAMAIASLSSGSWDPVEQQKLEAKPYSRRGAAHNKRGGHRKSLAKINSSNGSNVMAPVQPSTAKNSAKRKRTDDVSSGLSEGDIQNSQAAADDHLQGGKFVRSAKQTVVNNASSLDPIWYKAPWFRPPESPLKLPNQPELTVTNTAGGVPAEAGQTNGFLMTGDLSPFFLQGSGIQLVQVFPSSTFGQSSDGGISPQLTGDPHLLQLISQHGNFLTLSIPNSPNPSPAVVEDLDSSLPDDVTATAAGTTSPACPAQLPGSLSTLRNYYNMTNTSEPLAGGHPSAKIGGPSKVHIVSQPSIAGSYQITNDQFVKMGLSTSDVASIGGQSLLHTTTGQRPKLPAGDNSASTLNNRTTSSTVGKESSLVSMPGSLNILRSYYSSLDQKTKQIATVRPSTDVGTDHIRTADCQSPSETPESALNLSKHRQGDRNEIQGIRAIKAVDSVRSCLLPEEELPGMTVNLKKMLNNGNNGQCSMSSFVLGSASTPLSSPHRILPMIGESQALNAAAEASPVSSHLSDDQKRPDSAASSISSVHLPPKKRRKAPSPIGMPLDNCCMVVGDQKVPLNVFMSTLDSETHQNVINQIQSAIINQQILASASSREVSSKLPVISSQINLASSSSTQRAAVPNLNVNVNSAETVNCAIFSIPSSMMSPNVHRLDVGLMHEKKTVEVPAKYDDGGSDQEECHSNGKGSLQFLSSLSQLPTPSSSGQILNSVLQPDEDGDLPLHVAVAREELEDVEKIVSMMRAMNATIDCRNYLRQTPLHVAVVTGDCDIVTCLLEAGASPNIADRNGQNCFHLAVKYKQIECLEVLFTCTESRPDLLNYEGLTPLHLAVKLNLPDAVTTLLRNRVQPDAVDGKSGHTALYMAADTNRVRIAEILLSYGANVLIASYSGCSPVQAASSKSFHEMVKLLVKHGGCSDPERSSDSKDSSEFGAHSRKGKG